MGFLSSTVLSMLGDDPLTAPLLEGDRGVGIELLQMLSGLTKSAEHPSTCNGFSSQEPQVWGIWTR